MNFLLRDHISYGRRLTSVYDSIGLCKRSAGHRTVPGRFCTDENSSRAMMYTLISKFAIIPPKKQVVKIRMTQADSNSDEDENHNCSRLQKIQ